MGLYFQYFFFSKKKKLTRTTKEKDLGCEFCCRTSLSLLVLIYICPAQSLCLYIHTALVSVNFHLCNTCAYIFQTQQAMCPVVLFRLPFLWPWPKKKMLLFHFSLSFSSCWFFTASFFVLVRLLKIKQNERIYCSNARYCRIFIMNMMLLHSLLG